MPKLEKRLEIKRIPNKKSKYDTSSKDKLCICCDEPAAITIKIINGVEGKKDLSIHLCEKHRDDLKTFLQYFS